MTGKSADMPSPDVVDALWVADMLGLAHRNAVSTYQKRFADMPRPTMNPGPGRPKLWNRQEMEDWAISTGSIQRKEKWHADPHYQDILEGLERDLDTDLFEACMVDILDIPVVPIEGGSDGGMDGAVFDGEDEPFPLITTTAESVIRNLTNSLESYKKTGGKRRKAALATSRQLTARRRRNLNEKASGLGFALVQIYDQRAVADRLYRNSRWCKSLLGLTGEPLPFQPFPPPTRPLLHLELIGRSAETDFLLSGQGDQLLVGLPGSGKTAILSTFAEEAGALFMHRADPAGINNGLRRQRPTIVIVDDAHTRMDDLQLLVRLRHERELSYRIVSSVWPDQATENDISDILGLGSADTAEVPLLARDEIVEVIRDVGVEGPSDLVREIVNQARGLPGLAVTLARACRKGGIRDIASGDAVGREIRRVLDAQGLPNAIDILAALGIAGELGLSLDDAAEDLGLSPPEVRREMAELATAGILSRVGNGRWAVYPIALRHVVVRDVFFGSPEWKPDRFIERVTRTSGDTAEELEQLRELYPDFAIENRPHKEIARTLMGAKRAGGRVPWHLIMEHLRRSDSNKAWEDWAWFGPREARQTLQEQPAALLEWPKPFLYWIPEEALSSLLDAASQNQKAPLHTSKSPPLQVIAKWAKDTWKPDEVLRRRRLATQVAIRWGTAHPESDLPCHVLSAVLSPGFEKSDLDPGAGRTLTIRRGDLHDFTLREIGSLWADPMLPFLRTRPVGTLRPIVTVVLSWTNLSQAPSESPSTEPGEEGPPIATEMITGLLELTADHPGLWSEVARLAEEAGMETDPPDWEYMLMYGPLDRSDLIGWEAAEADRVEKARDLGKSRADSDPATVASRLAFLETAAKDAGRTWPRYTPQYAEALAQHSNADPLEWVRSFVAAGLHFSLVEPFLSRATGVGVPETWQVVGDLVGQPEYEWLAIETTITASDAPPELECEAMARLASYTKHLEWTVLRDEVDPNTTVRLLHHENDDVASTVAITMWSKADKPPSEPEVAFLWRKAILRTADNPSNSYRLERILASDQDLAVEWLTRHFTNSPAIFITGRSPAQVAIDSLDGESSIRLLSQIQSDNWQGQGIARVVGNRPAVYRALLEDENLRDLHLAPLGGILNEDGMGLGSHWERLAEMALECGYGPDQVAEATFPRSYVWDGRESEMWESWIAAFKAMTSNTPEFRAIQAIGIKAAQDWKEDALRREQKRRVYGDNYPG